MVQARTNQDGTTYRFNGYTSDTELVEGFQEFLDDNDMIESESKAVVYAIRTMLQQEEYIND